MPNGTDSEGTSCSIAPCIQRCKNAPPNTFFGLPLPTGGVTAQERCEEKCKAAAKRFLEWFDKQMREGKPNYGNLPACPCSITCWKLNRICRPSFRNGADRDPVYEYEKSICAPIGWRLVSFAATPFYLDNYHPGAAYDLRSIKGPPYSQCTYDKNGKLITTGPGVGSVDEGYAPSGVHTDKDVDPFKDIIFLQTGGEKITSGCWYNLYRRMRPLLNRNKCPRNP